MNRHKKVFDQLRHLTTERRNSRSLHIDVLPIHETLKLINREDQKVAASVGREIRFIAKAVAVIVHSFREGGRLVYVGAGTSGRLGILDAAECPPTYGTKPSTVQGVIAGGRRSVFRSMEGVEDSERMGSRDMKKLRLQSSDVVCGIAASMRTPYVIAALREAKRQKAKTIFVTTNSRNMLNQKQFSGLRRMIDVAICPVVGPEVIMGSTRMKSGTAQKMVLNMMTTVAMIQLGKVYENMMVDLKMKSTKLRERAKRVVMNATGADYKTASNALSKADGHAKTAIVMIKCNINAAQARSRLQKANGFVRYAITGILPRSG